MASRPLRILDPKTPCTVDWGTMTGSDRVRHCAQCELDVYDLSKMTADEAAALFQSANGRVCARFFRRADGTVVTRDCEVPVARLGDFEIDRDAARLLPREICEKYGVIVIARPKRDTATIAMRDPADILAIDEARFVTGMNLEPVYAPDAEIRAAIDRVFEEDVMLMGEIVEEPPPPEIVPEAKALSREFILSEVARSLRETHPERADAMIREIERAVLQHVDGDAAACPHCNGPVLATTTRAR